MLRYLAGVASALLLVAAGVLWWKGAARADSPIPPAPPAAVPAGRGPLIPAPPPAASGRTREEKRFARYDKDRDGGVAREEYLASRRKAFAKLDANGDGRLTFDEWAAKTTTKFAAADADRSGVLDAAEFATTRVPRKAAARCACPPASAEAAD